MSNQNVRVKVELELIRRFSAPVNDLLVSTWHE